MDNQVFGVVLALAAILLDIAKKVPTQVAEFAPKLVDLRAQVLDVLIAIDPAYKPVDPVTPGNTFKDLPELIAELTRLVAQVTDLAKLLEASKTENDALKAEIERLKNPPTPAGA